MPGQLRARHVLLVAAVCTAALIVLWSLQPRATAAFLDDHGLVEGAASR